MKDSEVMRQIEKRGGVFIRQSGGYRRYKVLANLPDGSTTTLFTTVVVGRADIPTGTLRAIERDLELAFGERWLR